MNVAKISIFNRYGKEVYSKNNYTNEWHGQGSNGDTLDTGTYFYSLEIRDGSPKTGWIYINRQN
jgi:gliding motility-associated-like protein